jgi:hypothetical protein
MDKRLDTIRALEEQVRKLTESSENKRRLTLWEDSAISNDYWHGIPKTNRPLFTLELERATYARIIGFSVVDFYKDPYVHIEANLRMMIFKFENIQDCTPIGKAFACYLGAGFERSLFGGESIYTDQDAWMGRGAIIEDRVDISTLEPVDFYKSSVMSETHRFYEQVRSILSDDFDLTFPQWSRSPFGVAWHIRGIDNLLYDLVEDPEWFGAFLNYVTDCRIKWVREREQFTGVPMHNCNIYNDEVTSPMISPATYRDFILPTEIRLSNEFGGINYWHSCGNTTSFVEYINQIPNLHMVTVSAWTDLERAEHFYDKEHITLEKQLHPYEGILGNPVRSNFEEGIRRITDGFKGSKGIVRAEGIQMTDDFEKNLRYVRQWCACANEMLM